MKTQLYNATVTLQIPVSIVAADADHAKRILDRALEESDLTLSVESAPMAAAMKIRKAADRNAAFDALFDGDRCAVVSSYDGAEVDAWIDGMPELGSVEEVSDGFFPAGYGPDDPSVFADWASPPDGAQLVQPIEFLPDADGRLISSDGHLEMLVEQAN